MEESGRERSEREEEFASRREKMSEATSLSLFLSHSVCTVVEVCDFSFGFWVFSILIDIVVATFLSFLITMSMTPFVSRTNPSINVCYLLRY